MRPKKIKVWFAKATPQKTAWLSEPEWIDLVRKHIGNEDYCDDPHVYMGKTPVRLANFWYSILGLSKDIPGDAAYQQALNKTKEATC